MKLVNPKGDAKRVKTLQTVKWVLLALIVVAALVETIVIMFPYIKEMLLTYRTSGMEIGLMYVGGSFVVYIILAVIIWFCIGKAVKKCAAGVEIDLGNNIAVCDCGNRFKFGDLSWTVHTGGTRRVSNDDLTRISTDTLGSIKINVRCAKCGAEKSSYISDVVLSTETSVTRHKIAEDKDVTTTSTDKKSGNAIREIVRDRFDSDGREFSSTFNEYKDLGYRREDGRSSAGK